MTEIKVWESLSNSVEAFLITLMLDDRSEVAEEGVLE